MLKDSISRMFDSEHLRDLLVKINEEYEQVESEEDQATAHVLLHLAAILKTKKHSDISLQKSNDGNSHESQLDRRFPCCLEELSGTRNRDNRGMECSRGKESNAQSPGASFVKSNQPERFSETHQQQQSDNCVSGYLWNRPEVELRATLLGVDVIAF